MNDYAALFEELPKSATILTPNQRLSAYLRKQYQESQNTFVFETPDILPIQAWLHRLYDIALTQAWCDKICLTTEQTLFLWEQIIQEYPPTQTLLSKAHQTAQLAHQAWDLLNAWQIPLSTLKNAHHPETELFLFWLEPFQAALKQHHWLTPAELPLYLSHRLPSHYCQTLFSHYLIGFEEIPPHLTTLFSKLDEHAISIESDEGSEPRKHSWDRERHGCRVRAYRDVFTACPKSASLAPSLPTNSKNYQTTCKTSSEEFKSALAYAKNVLEQNPTARIGIVVPDLKTHRSTLMALSQKLFYPDAFLQEPEINEFVNISGGIPLKETLLVETIFSVLKLPQQRIALPDLHGLWHSPYLNFGEYEWKRPLLDARLQQSYPKYVSHTTLMRFLHTQLDFTEANLPSFYKALTNHPGHTPSAKTHQAWLQILHQYLLDLGFPGNRVLSSSEIQRLKAWEEVLKTFAALDRVNPAVSFEEAIKQLQYLCQQKLFQAKTKDTPIHILGLLEASGLSYTHLWITGLNEGTFPSPPNPNPLLPIALQRKWRMPHADVEREFEFAQRILMRLLAYSGESICSYSQESENNLLRKSALIRDFPLFNATFSFPEIKAIPLKTEWIDDRYGLAINSGAPTKGGSTLFKLQAQCPFKAYAILRLKAEENPAINFGLSPALRGNLVHRALEYFYQKITAQSELLSLTLSEKESLLQEACSKALDFLNESYSPAEHPYHYDLEHLRLKKLLQLWLEQEKNRPHFKIVATEKRLEAEFAGLQLSLRIDRIDRLDNGDEIIIDYKTGLVHVDDWFSDRPNEPQLPLYCSLYDNDIKAIAFAKVHLQKIGLEGVGVVDDTWTAISSKRLCFSKIEGIDPWQQQQALWREQLTLLAEEYKQGYAAVSPKEGDKTCQQCHLPSLCRIRQQNPLEEETP